MSGSRLPVLVFGRAHASHASSVLVSGRLQSSGISHTCVSMESQDVSSVSGFLVVAVLAVMRLPGSGREGFPVSVRSFRDCRRYLHDIVVCL